MVFSDASLRKPAAKLRARASTERLSRRELGRTGCLADDRDAIADGSRDYRTSAPEIACFDALGACPDTRMEPR
jgi:hypothetical protein